MPRRVKHVRVDNATMQNFIGELAELIVNTSRYSLHVHDGKTPNGFELALANMENVPTASELNNGRMSSSQAQQLAQLLVDLATLDAEVDTLPTFADVEAGDAATLLAAQLPIGSIIMWHGLSSAIPSGWAICDGTSGTPDLRNKFVIGAGDAYALNDIGGSADAVVVNHGHTASTNQQGSHYHAGGKLVMNADEDSDGATGNTDFVLSGTITTNGTINVTNVDSGIPRLYLPSDGLHAHTVTVTNTGVSGTGANLPPYHGLFYIKRVA